MSLQRPEFPDTPQKIFKSLNDIFNNLSFDDLHASALQTKVPTSSTLVKGRARIVEINNVPRLYWRGTNGTIYLLAQGTAV